MQIDHFTITVPLNSHPIYNSTGVDAMQWRSLWRWPKRQTSNVSPHFTTECKFCLQSNSNFFRNLVTNQNPLFLPNLSASHLLTFIQSEKMMRCAGAYRRNVFVRCQLHWSMSVVTKLKQYQSKSKVNINSSAETWRSPESVAGSAPIMMSAFYWWLLYYLIDSSEKSEYCQLLHSSHHFNPPLHVMLQSDSFTEEGLCSVS